MSTLVLLVLGALVAGCGGSAEPHSTIPAPVPDAAADDAGRDGTARSDDESEGAPEIDIGALLADESDTSGALSRTDLESVDTQNAPRLGTTLPLGLEGAEWLVLPGDALEIPSPEGWLRKKEGNIGLIGAPDKKAFILFTTYQNQQQLESMLTEVGKKLEINKVDWKKPHEVKLGQDSLPALVRGGQLTAANGEKGSILFALVESGKPDKVLALALADDDVSKETKDRALSIILAMRKKR